MDCLMMLWPCWLLNVFCRQGRSGREIEMVKEVEKKPDGDVRNKSRFWRVLWLGFAVAVALKGSSLVGRSN